MTEQETDLQDPRVLHRAAEHLTDRWAGVFFPELDDHDTGPVAVALLAEHAGPAVVTRSVGIAPGTAPGPVSERA